MTSRIASRDGRIRNPVESRLPLCIALRRHRGMIWTSNQCDPDDTLILFGDELAAARLSIVEARNDGETRTLTNIRRAIARPGINTVV